MIVLMAEVGHRGGSCAKLISATPALPWHPPTAGRYRKARRGGRPAAGLTAKLDPATGLHPPVRTVSNEKRMSALWFDAKPRSSAGYKPAGPRCIRFSQGQVAMREKWA